MTPAEHRSAERWHDVQRVVDGALDLAPGGRASYLDEVCGDDVELRERAARFLSACERAAHAEGMLAVPASAFAAPMLADLAVGDGSRRQQRRAQLRDALRDALAGRYAVEHELGHGGMATVYLAHDLRRGRPVAIKVLEQDSVVHGGAERFRREVAIAARLSHPNVLGLHDAGEEPGGHGHGPLLYYVMPFVEGETLRARLARDGALPIPEATRLLRELADALAYAHALGVVHRDLKPENVLLHDGHAVVADFGIARAIEAVGEGAVSGEKLTATGVSLGTPAYMAPEQVAGAVDHRVDLYALGVIAYEMLAGTHPFDARSPQALATAQLTQPPTPLRRRRPETPLALESLVMRLLAKSPADRPQSGADVRRLLDDGAANPRRY